MSDLKENLSKLEQSERDALADAYRSVLDTAEGKRVLFDILEQCTIYQLAFTGDNNATNFRLGIQEAGRRVLARLDGIDPRLYPRLLLERADMKAMDMAAQEAGRNEGVEDYDIEA